MGNVSNIAISGLFFMLCLNIGILVIDQDLGLPVSVLTPAGADQYGDTFNSSSVVDSWSGYDSQFYDIGFALWALWSKIWILVFGVPQLLSSLGMSATFSAGVYGAWSFLVFIFILAFIKGSDL